MTWKTYAVTMLLFNLAGVLAVYRAAAGAGVCCHWNPAGLGAVSPDSSFNTAVSFRPPTRTWQGYGGESTMSYLTADARASRSRNFASAAAGHGGAPPR